MVFIDETIAVADAAVGTDLAAKKEWAKSQFNRLLTGFALTGGNAAEQVALSVKFNKQIVATLRNSVTGLVVNTNEQWRPVQSALMCPAGQEVNVIVDAAPTVSPIKLMMNLAEVP